MWPPTDELLAAWRRLVDDRDTAGVFCALVLSPLEADLARQFRLAHRDDVTAAVDTAIAAFIQNPTAFDPARGTLPGLLRLAARGDLLNLLDAEARHRRGRIPWESVELTYPARNELEEGGCLLDHPGIRAAVVAFSDTERQVFELMRDGERATAVFAEALGITDRPADEQAREVKRAKDRIMARLKRAAEEP